MVDLQKYNDFVVAKTVERDRLKRELNEVAGRKKICAASVADGDRARTIVNEVLMLTQETVREYVENVVSLALSTVYDGRYSFELEHSIKRNQSEIEPWIVKGRTKCSPRDEVGGGVLDIASLAMRLAVWSLMEPKPAPVFVLDEPGKYLSQDLQETFGEMLREISKLMGVQIILISHSEHIIESADKAYSVTQTKGISNMKEI